MGRPRGGVPVDQGGGAESTRITIETHLQVLPEPGRHPRPPRGRRPRRYVVWSGLVSMLLVAAVVGVGN